MSPSWADAVRLVRHRAGGRCEYCRMHESLQGATFHVEHIAPTSRGGSDDPENLAWSCPRCNLTKSARVMATDPMTDKAVALFNPRRDRWSDNLRWDGYQIVGLTPIGRALVAAFDLNHPRRVLIRRAEEHFRLFPPEEGPSATPSPP
jgi:hypothetical protein